MTHRRNHGMPAAASGWVERLWLSDPPKQNLRPLVGFLCLLLVISSAEALVVLALTALPKMSTFFETIIDSLFITLILAPVLWRAVVMPLRNAAQNRAAAALGESDSRYHSLFENMLEGYAHCKMLFEHGEPQDWLYIDVNAAFEQLTGLKNVVGKTVRECIPGIRESNPELFDIYGRVALTGKAERFETHVEPLGIWFSIAVYSPGKEYFTAVFDNITERKQVEEALKLFRTLIDRSNDIIEVVDPVTGRFLDVNERGCLDLGYTREEVLELSVFDIDPMVDKESFATSVNGLRKSGTLRWEGIHRRKNGSTFPVEVGISYVQLDREYAVAVVRDITERTQLQAQFLQAQKMEVVGRLASGIAHDFNNLLTVINGTADIASMDLREDDSLRADFQEIRRAGERAASLTGQLLAFSRRQVMKPEVLNLSTLITDLQGMLQRLIGEDIDLVVVPAKDVGSVRADPGQIEQVVMNLAVNARDAMLNGGTLTIETGQVELDEIYAAEHPSVQPGPHVMLAISDTGVGMDEATRTRIFEPFFTTKGPGRGTGLGLSTVYGIVKQSGGSIWVYSEVGKGTTFKIYLAQVEAVAREDQPARTPSAARGNETILMVEDEEAIRLVAKRILERAGYTVLVAANGGEALALLERHDGAVHLLFTDVVMPGLSGRELAKTLASSHPEMKVLYTSGYTDSAIVHHGMLDEGTIFIHKPYAIEGLTRKIREVLDL
jgi:two-component system cell cycle sensor histidine kinase/response regulator CckA